MESSNNFKSIEQNGDRRYVIVRVIAAMRFVARQLADLNLNPHEGKLRASGMPVEHMHIPDYPPIQ